MSIIQGSYVFEDPFGEDTHYVSTAPGKTHALIVRDEAKGDRHGHVESFHSSGEEAEAALRRWLNTGPVIPESSMATVVELRPE